MSKAFLNQIPKIEDSVQSDDGHSCYICFQQCGTLCPESGVIEVAVRLPCQHVIGSACIAKWLHTNNTCPVCREVFFPLEHEDTDDEDLAPSETEFGEERREDLEVSARNAGILFCAALHISTPIANLAERITAKIASSYLVGIRRFADRAAAACIYVATQIMGEPRTFEEIAGVAPTPGINAFSVWLTYSRLYPMCQEMIEDSWTDDLGSENLQIALALLHDDSASAMEDSIREGLEALGW